MSHETRANPNPNNADVIILLDSPTCDGETAPSIRLNPAIVITMTARSAAAASMLGYNHSERNVSGLVFGTRTVFPPTVFSCRPKYLFSCGERVDVYAYAVVAFIAKKARTIKTLLNIDGKTCTRFF